MSVAFKLFLWLFEFKLKRVPDDKKVIFLTNQLLDELEGQGYDCSPTHRDLFSLNVSWFKESETSLRVGSVIHHWEINGKRGSLA